MLCSAGTAFAQATPAPDATAPAAAPAPEDEQRHHRHRAEALGESPGRADQHPGARHASSSGAERRQFQRLYPAAAVDLLPDARSPARPTSISAASPRAATATIRARCRRVGVYLDEQPVTTIGGTLDVHIYDIARIEALRGPQGTLYGASSEAGTIRIITNRPDTAQLLRPASTPRSTRSRHGGIGGSLEGFVNAPLSDSVALRLVGWYQHDAGYIDNVPGTRAFRPLPGGIVVNNNALVENNYQRRRYDRRPRRARHRSRRALDGDRQRDRPGPEVATARSATIRASAISRSSISSPTATTTASSRRR